MPSNIKPTKYQKEQRARAARLWRELKKAPLGELVGVVAAAGVSGGRSQGERHLTLTIPLVAWRWEGGIVQHRPLVVSKQTSEREVQQKVDTVQGFEVVRMRARLAIENCTGTPRAMMLTFGRHGKDRELREFAATLRKPVVMRDKRFGVLKLNRSSAAFEGAIKWNGQRTQLVLETNPDGSAQMALRLAAKLMSAQAKWQRLVRNRLAKSLYREWKQIWRLEDERAQSSEQFLRRLRLRSIHVSAKGHVHFVFADGDQFGGHDVVVSGNVDRGIARSELAG